jgi:pimeloyl-ACP methyl ester carboxylesterase
VSNKPGAWRTAHSTVSGFHQFFRNWQPGTESQFPVLALHGSLTQSGMWCALAERARSIRMLCPDLRGFGLSEDPGGDACADFARDVQALTRDLLPARFAVMGHSFACSIALELARMEPARVAAVVLVDPVVRLGPPAPGSGAPAPRPESFASLEEAERHFLETEEGEWPREALKRFAADVMIPDSGSWRFPYTQERLRRLRAFTASATSDYDLFVKAKSVHCPVLVFRGGMSKRFPAAAEAPFLRAFSAPASCVLCPKSGHFPTATETQIVEDALKKFPTAIT